MSYFIVFVGMQSHPPNCKLYKYFYRFYYHKTAQYTNSGQLVSMTKIMVSLTPYKSWPPWLRSFQWSFQWSFQYTRFEVGLFAGLTGAKAKTKWFWWIYVWIYISRMCWVWYLIYKININKKKKKKKKKKKRKKKKKKILGESGYRSRYLSHAKRALYHLS